MFGTPSSSPAFGTPSTPAFGAPSMSNPFGTPSATPAFGTPSSTPMFTPSSTPSFGAASSISAFGAPSTPSFSTGFGSSLFSTPFSQQQASPFQQQSSSAFGFSSSFGVTPQTAQPTSFGQPFGQLPAQQTSPLPFGNVQLTTQMAPVAPLPFSLADRDIQAIVEAYKEEPGNTKYAFKHLLFSVTEPQHRIKPAIVSDIMWAEAIGKLEGMDSSDRDRLWPQLVQGFKDLSLRLKLQDEVISSDAERLRTTQSNVKMLQRHVQAGTLPWIERMRQKEQVLQRRLLKVMRILEALEGKGFRIPLVKGEADLAEKLSSITRQLKGSGAELSRRVQNLLNIVRLQASNGVIGNPLYLPGSTKIHDQSLADMHEVLQQQTEAIAKLGNVLKRDVRDIEIIMDEDTEMTS